MKIIFTFLVALSFTMSAIAADGDVDRTFKTDVTENNGSIRTVAVQPDNKILVGGFFESFGGRARRGIARLNEDGSLDLSFDPVSAIPNAIAAQATVRAIAVQTDGKILVGISFASISATPQKMIVRLYPDGTNDSTFNSGLLTSLSTQDGVFALALQPDGKVLVGGNFRFNNDTNRDIARLNPDGSIDSSFDPTSTGGIGAIGVRAISVQPDGKILCGGTGFNGGSPATIRQAFWRLNSDGSLDSSYGSSTTPSSGEITALTSQSDGVMYAGGNVNFAGQTVKIMRILQDGARDANFSDIFSSVAAAIWKIARQNDGKLVVVGDFQITNPAIRNRIVRLNADGTLDTTFNTGGSTAVIYSVGLQTDGRSVAAGDFNNFDGSPAEGYLRLNMNGSRDSTFVSNSYGYDGRVNAMLRQSDGKIFIGFGATSGFQTKVNGVRFNGISRLNKDYSVDNSFTSPLSAGSSVTHLALQNDGKILIGGNLIFNSNTSRLMRLNADGTVDSGFNPPANLKIPVVQTDGKIIAAAVNGSAIFRLESNGSLDNTFTADLGSGNLINALALQTDGKILVAGLFSAINGTLRSNIARLNNNGSVDTDFNPNTSANDIINTILLRTDGRIFIGGFFTNFNGTARNRVALLESNGGLNNSFIPSNPANIDVSTLALQSDNKLLFGGSQGSSSTRGIYRLNTDGSSDNSFLPGASSNEVFVRAILPQTNGKIMVGGIFDTYNGIPRMGLARLNTRNQTADFDGDGKTDISAFRPSSSFWYIRNSTNNQFFGVQWGFNTDKLTPADFDGDGKTDIAVWRENSFANFYILNSTNNTVRVEQFGQTGDDPSMVGDWDGDGKADVAVYRNAAFGNQSYFFYRGSLNNPNGNTTFLPWGADGDRAVRGDFDGDEILDAAVFRPSNGIWYVRRSSDNSLQAQQFGLNTDKLAANDYDGDGKTDLAVFRPSNGVWFIKQSASDSLRIDYWGLSTDIFVPADYDADGRTDLAVYRGGIWYLKQSTDGIRYDNFGLPGDIPIPFVH